MPPKQVLNARRLDHRRKYRGTSGGSFGGGTDQRAEQPRVAALLRVPLHAADETGKPPPASPSLYIRRSGLDRLDRAVLLPGHRLEPLTEQVNRLMAPGAHV